MTALEIPAGRVGWAARLIVGGLLVTAVTLVWDSPLGFLAFVLVGGGLSAAGVLLFLWTIVVQSVSHRKGG